MPEPRRPGASGLAVVDVTARARRAAAGAVAGHRVRLDGDAPQDRTPVDDPATNPLSSGIPNFNFYTLEVVQRIGYDSFTPDNGVLIAKNKDRPSTTGGPNGVQRVHLGDRRASGRHQQARFQAARRRARDAHDRRLPSAERRALPRRLELGQPVRMGGYAESAAFLRRRFETDAVAS